MSQIMKVSPNIEVLGKTTEFRNYAKNGIFYPFINQIL